MCPTASNTAGVSAAVTIGPMQEVVATMPEAIIKILGVIQLVLYQEIPWVNPRVSREIQEASQETQWVSREEIQEVQLVLDQETP